MKELDKIRSWNNLKEIVGKIYDYKTRKMYYNALLARAIKEWGFNPEKPTDESFVPELDDWEKEFVDDMNETVMFGFDTFKDKRKKEKDLLQRNMRYFVIKGGTLADIPENLRTKDVINEYFEQLKNEGDELCELADSVLKGERI